MTIFNNKNKTTENKTLKIKLLNFDRDIILPGLL